MDEHGAEVSAEAMAARLAAKLGALAGMIEKPGAAAFLPGFAAQMRAMRDEAKSLAEALAGVPGEESGEAPDDQAARPAEVVAGQAMANAGEGMAAPRIVLLLSDALAAAQHIRQSGAPDWQAAKAAADAAAEQDRRESRLTVEALRLALDVLAHGARRQVETMAGRDQAERQAAADGVAAAYARLGVTLAALDRFAVRLQASEDGRGQINEKWKAEHPDFWAVANATDATHQLACTLGSVPIGTLSALAGAVQEISIGQKPRLFAAEKTRLAALGHIDAFARGYAALAMTARVRSGQPAKDAAEAVATACRDRTPGEVLRWHRNAPNLDDLARDTDPGTERQTGGKGPTRDAMVRLARECFAIGAPRAATTPEGWRRIAQEIETQIADLYGRRHALAWRRRRDDPSRFPSTPLRRELSGSEE